MNETMMEKLYREAASLEPRHSPWGSIDGMRWIANGIYSVSTPSHGGIMVHKSVADKVLSKEAQEVGFVSEPFICFEEDCDAPVLKTKNCYLSNATLAVWKNSNINLAYCQVENSNIFHINRSIVHCPSCLLDL
ncbi:MAG: hypothetical protein E7653_02690 [Ruminococcaceae bacterium]|nr:hypothetical protein [Oscillospiraceae bacterium]